MGYGKEYKEFVAENYDELVRDFCDENSGDFEIYCNEQSHIMEEFADNDSNFEEFCRERYANN